MVKTMHTGFYRVNDSRVYPRCDGGKTGSYVQKVLLLLYPRCDVCNVRSDNIWHRMYGDGSLEHRIYCQNKTRRNKNERRLLLLLSVHSGGMLAAKS